MREWLATPAARRVQYFTRDDEQPEESRIARVLAPHQTIQERNITGFLSESGGGGAYNPPVWLRTCYDPDLEDRYQEMYSDAEIIDIEAELVDEALYNFGDDWEKIFFRLPQLARTDLVRDDPARESGREREEQSNGHDNDGGDDDHDNDNDGGDDDDADDFDAIINAAYDIEPEVRYTIYVLDAEAIRTGLIKIKWLGEFGDVVWENKVAPEQMQDLKGGMGSGQGLGELVGAGSSYFTYPDEVDH